ncbi:MAG: serine/threonine protein kinase [Proteobacteria bacterium]|nr:serine/threonine protein kinase [Pseudomonadota bacterium]
MQRLSEKNGQTAEASNVGILWDSEIYELAIADTLPARPLRSLRDLAQKKQTDAVVSEIRRGLGDTADSSLVFDSAVDDKTVSLVTECASGKKSGERTKVDSPQMVRESLQTTLPVLEPIDVETPSKNEPFSSTSSVDFKVKAGAQWFGAVQKDAVSLRNSGSYPGLSKTVVKKADEPQLLATMELAHMRTINLGPDGCVPLERRDMISELETPIAAVQKAGFKTSREASHEINIGAVVAQRYEVLSEISRGGYGVVYRARQLGLDRIVALKRLRTQQDRSVMQRFLLEADIIKSLIHPNTIQLIDAGIDDNCQFIVMEYIEGQSLRTLLNHEGRLDVHRSIHIACQILKSVNEAHQKGIVHRDLKPSNIMLREVIGEHDFVKVLDFGIAKARHRTGMQLTQNGKIMGTPQYIAPELLWGEQARPRTDVFAVGLILAEMISGKAILPSDPIKAAHLATDKAPISLPSWLEASELGVVLHRALEKDPEKRYQTAQSMLSDLERVSARLLLSSSGQRGKRASSRNSGFKPYQIMVMAALFVIANVLVVYHLVWM